ncbi:unnamed protein product, partial [marine sediment metagenome]
MRRRDFRSGRFISRARGTIDPTPAAARNAGQDWEWPSEGASHAHDDTTRVPTSDPRVSGLEVGGVITTSATRYADRGYDHRPFDSLKTVHTVEHARMAQELADMPLVEGDLVFEYHAPCAKAAIRNRDVRYLHTALMITQMGRFWAKFTEHSLNVYFDGKDDHRDKVIAVLGALKNRVGVTTGFLTQVMENARLDPINQALGFARHRQQDRPRNFDDNLMDVDDDDAIFDDDDEESSDSDSDSDSSDTQMDTEGRRHDEDYPQHTREERRSQTRDQEESQFRPMMLADPQMPTAPGRPPNRGRDPPDAYPGWIMGMLTMLGIVDMYADHESARLSGNSAAQANSAWTKFILRFGATDVVEYFNDLESFLQQMYTHNWRFYSVRQTMQMYKFVGVVKNHDRTLRESGEETYRYTVRIEGLSDAFCPCRTRECGTGIAPYFYQIGTGPVGVFFESCAAHKHT